MTDEALPSDNARVVFDPKGAMERLGVSEDEFWELVEVSRLECEGRLQALAESLLLKDMAHSARHAHTLKSTAANIGASVTQGLSASLEAAARSGDHLGAARLLTQVNEALADLWAAVDRTTNAPGV